MRVALLASVLCLAVACSAPPRSRMRSLEDLPPGYADAWRAWLEEDPAWPEIRTRALDDPPLARFLVDNLAHQMLASFGESRVATLDDERLGRFERARANLIIMQAASTPVLVELLAIGNSQADALVSGLLVEIGRPAVLPVAGLLERKEPNEARMRAARLLGDLPHALGEEDAVRTALVRRLAEDPEWLVRSVAATAIGKRGSRDRQTAAARTALVAALTDEDYAVQRSAAVALGTLQDPEAIPALIAYLERTASTGEIVSLRAAQRSLRQLSGESVDKDPKAWRAWWRDHRPAPVGGRSSR